MADITYSDVYTVKNGENGDARFGTVGEKGDNGNPTLAIGSDIFFSDYEHRGTISEAGCELHDDLLG